MGCPFGLAAGSRATKRWNEDDDNDDDDEDEDEDEDDEESLRLIEVFEQGRSGSSDRSTDFEIDSRRTILRDREEERKGILDDISFLCFVLL